MYTIMLYIQFYIAFVTKTCILKSLGTDLDQQGRDAATTIQSDISVEEMPPATGKYEILAPYPCHRLRVQFSKIIDNDI